jgi:hypothetical protein
MNENCEYERLHECFTLFTLSADAIGEVVYEKYHVALSFAGEDRKYVDRRVIHVVKMFFSKKYKSSYEVS